MISNAMPQTSLTSTHHPGTSPAKTLVDKSGRFNRLQPAFQKQLQELAEDFYETYHSPLILTDTYRTRAEQARAHREKPDLALPANHPHAMHPRGLAVDVDQKQAGKITPEMLAENGLHLPALSKGETWHIEPKLRSFAGSSPSSPRSFYGSKTQLSKSFAQGMSQLKLQTQLSEPLSLLQQYGLNEGGATDEHRRLQAAMEVEAIFLGQLLEIMRRSMVESVGSSPKSLKGYLAIADQQLARTLAAGGGLGLASEILQDLAPSESPSHKENHHAGNLLQPGGTDPPGTDPTLSKTL
jgi:Rod binding domain-containing protein